MRMRLPHPLIPLILVLTATTLPGQYSPDIFKKDRARLEPLADIALRDTAITRSPEGEWLMTGTVPGEDGLFQNNDGVFLWKSSDFSTWEPVGQVWSIDRDGDEWHKESRVNPDNPRGDLVRGVTSPEIHFLKDTYWIPYSMNAQGTGLLRSTSGRPEGPYEDVGRITAEGSDASLFQDEDGTVYWVVGEGWIAPMTDDLSALSEAPRLLQPAPFPPGVRDKKTPGGGSTHSPRTIGIAGAHLFRAEGRYWLAGAMVRDRIGVGCYDTFVCGADSLDGPFDQPFLMTAHGGQTTVFTGPGDRLHATFSGRDSRAVFRDKPAAIPLTFSNTVLYHRGQPAPPTYPRADFATVTEFGPWADLQPIADVQIRDLQFSTAPDGYTYLTGSGIDNSYAGKIMLFRSKDMANWEPVDVQFDFLSIPGVTEADRAARFDDPKHQRSLAAKYMDSEIYFAADTFHIFTSLYGGVKKADGSQAFNGPMWLRSTTGRPEGPYEYVDRASAQASAFQDDDGQWYFFFNGNLRPWDPTADAMDGPVTQLRTEMGTAFAKGDVATNLAKIHGKYLVFSTGWCGGTYGENYRVDGTYDWIYWQSDTLEGPYSMPRRAYAMPHAGHSSPPLQGPDGRWYGLLFGNDGTGPWWCMPGVLVFDVTLDPDDTVRVTIKNELP